MFKSNQEYLCVIHVKSVITGTITTAYLILKIKFVLTQKWELYILINAKFVIISKAMSQSK